MKRGQYSNRTITKSDAADPENLGVELGRLCILHKYSVVDVTEVFGVARMTVYNWFSGKNKPSRHLEKTVRTLVEKLRQKPIPVPSDENE